MGLKGDEVTAALKTQSGAGRGVPSCAALGWGAEQKDLEVSPITGLSPQQSGRAWAGGGALVWECHVRVSGKEEGTRSPVECHRGSPGRLGAVASPDLAG